MPITASQIDLANIPLQHSFNKIFSFLDARMTYILDDPNWWINLTAGEQQQILEILAGDWRNNFMYKYEIYNQTKDLTVSPKDFTLEIFSENSLGRIAPNRLNFTLEFFRGKYKGLTFDNIFATNDILKFKAINDPLNYEIFMGSVKDFTKGHTNPMQDIKVTAYDSYYKAYERQVPSAELYVDYYICNNVDKPNSLMHQLAYKLGFLDADLLLDNVTNASAQFITVPFAYLEKGMKYADEIAELARSVNCEIFIDVDYKLNLKKLDDLSDTPVFTFDSSNMQKKLNIETVSADCNGVKVVYDTFSIKPEQSCFKLIGPTGTETDAGIVIPAGTTSGNNNTWWGVNYITDIVTNINTTFVTSAYYYVGENKTYISGGMVENTHYEIEYDQAGGRIKFLNPEAYDIYVEQFEILAQPIYKYTQNEYSIIKAGVVEADYDLQEISNKYVQSPALAKEFTEFQYINKALDKKKISFISNLVFFLNPLSVVSITHTDYTGTMLITGLTHSPRESEIQLKDKINYTFSAETIIEQLSGVQDYNMQVARFEVKSLEERMTDLEGRVTALEP